MSQQSFRLTVIKNAANKVCSQQNINFVAGTASSAQITDIINNNIVKSSLVVKTNEAFFESFFDYTPYNKTINIANTTNSNLNQTSVVLQLTDSGNTRYQTNEFLLAVVRNNPPTVVFNPDKYTFYENSMTNVMKFNQSLFIDDDHVSIKVDE